MSSFAVKIADAVVAGLNDPARPWNIPTAAFTAARVWLPVYQAEELVDLKVSVVPVMIPEQKPLSRGRRVWEYEILIDFQKQVDPADTAAMDVLDAIAEQVNDYYVEGHRLAAPLAAWEVVRVKREQVYSLDMLYDEHTWETLVAPVFRGDR